MVAFPWARSVPVLCDTSSCEDLYQPGSHAERSLLGRKPQPLIRPLFAATFRDSLTASGAFRSGFVFKLKRRTGWNSAVWFPHLASHV